VPPKTPKYINAYYDTLHQIETQGALTEGAVRIAFQNVLTEAAKRHQFTVLAEQHIELEGKRKIRVDAEIRDQYKLRRGIWEAKDTSDNLDAEIKKKIAAGYPRHNTIFENTKRAVLFQNGEIALDTDITQAVNLEQLLHQFLAYTQPQIESFHHAVTEFKRQIPALGGSLAQIIQKEKRENKVFATALSTFWELCKSSLNPTTKLEEVEDMLAQHLLTERIFRSVFNNPDFVTRNAIARELEKVVAALTSRSFSRADFLGKLDYFYKAIEDAARTITDYSEKQSFLNTVYEQFFRSYSTDTADTHGIVYTPAPIVKWMVASVEKALQQEFGKSLSDTGVHVLDPCVGTGTFMLELMERIGNSNLPHKYAHELHCNEVLLLPYYIAAQNIEHEYFERTGQYQPFDGIVFADTLDMKRVQADMFAPENTERITAQEKTEIFAIIGNPPYNVGQENENDNNKNRKYPTVDAQIKTKYIRGSRASLHTKLYDMYVRFYRWATDRLGERDGVICFVTNNSFLDQLAFDQMRKKLLEEFTSIYVLDLGGNVRQNPKLSGTTHNVFGIQVGVIVALLIRNRGANPKSERATLRYARVDEFWRKEQKYKFLEDTQDLNGMTWEELEPDVKGAWLTTDMNADFDGLLCIGSKDSKARVVGAESTIFARYSLGISTNRDNWVYNFSVEELSQSVQKMIEFYNSELLRWQKRKNDDLKLDNFIRYDESKIKWSNFLKTTLGRSHEIDFDGSVIRQSTYRPFTKPFLYFKKPVIDVPSLIPEFLPNLESESENRLICVAGVGDRKGFGCLIVNHVPSLDLAFEKSQCFPFYVYDEDGSNRRENITDWALEQYQSKYGADITKWDVFHSIYGLLGGVRF
jgi:predicted helicase/ribosomal protein L7/L12